VAAERTSGSTSRRISSIDSRRSSSKSRAGRPATMAENHKHLSCRGPRSPWRSRRRLQVKTDRLGVPEIRRWR
jgi:hypothetical protein